MKLPCSNTHICTWADFHPEDSPDLFRNCRVNLESTPKIMCSASRAPNLHPNGFEKFPCPNPTRGRNLKAHKLPIQALPWRQASFLTNTLWGMQTICSGLNCFTHVECKSFIALLLLHILPSGFLYSRSHFTNFFSVTSIGLRSVFPRKLQKETGFLSQITES